MKKLTVGLIAVCMALSNVAATFDENIASKNYAKAVKQLTFDEAANSLSKLTIDDAACLYDAAWTNSLQDKAIVAAHVALQKGDNTKMIDFFNNADFSKNSSYDNVILGQAYLDLNKEFAYNCYTNARGANLVEWRTVNSLYPDMMLALYRSCAARGDFNAAALAFRQTSMRSENHDAFANHVTAEWKNFISTTFTPDVIAHLDSADNISAALKYYAKIDEINGDASQSTANSYCSDRLINQLARVSMRSFKTFPVESYRVKYYRALLEKSRTASCRINAAKWLDNATKTKTASQSLYPWVLEKCSFSTAADFALYTKDVDFILDVWSRKLDTTATADQINSILPILNTINAGYRSDDYKNILLNINKKYTLKLYDEHETWEPIISKVRAMIDIAR